MERHVRPLTEAEMRDYLANHADDALRGDCLWAAAMNYPLSPRWTWEIGAVTMLCALDLLGRRLFYWKYRP